jgi:hypothetical protein
MEDLSDRFPKEATIIESKAVAGAAAQVPQNIVRALKRIARGQLTENEAKTLSCCVCHELAKNPVLRVLKEGKIDTCSCRNVLCTACAQRILNTSKKCPTCRATFVRVCDDIVVSTAITAIERLTKPYVVHLPCCRDKEFTVHEALVHIKDCMNFRCVVDDEYCPWRGLYKDRLPRKHNCVAAVLKTSLVPKRKKRSREDFSHEGFEEYVVRSGLQSDEPYCPRTPSLPHSPSYSPA